MNKTFICLFSLLLLFCSKEKDKPVIDHDYPVLSDNGMTIKFPNQESMSRFTSVSIEKRTGFLSVLATAHVIASISNSVRNKEKVILFENPEIASLYSGYKKSQTDLIKARKNIARTKDMFENRVATRKDMFEAEAELTDSLAVIEENESRLRSFGFNPNQLESYSPGTILIVSELPESQLSQVELGETVEIVFSAYPDKVFLGKAESIGDSLDSTTRTAKIRVSLKVKSQKILPGMFANVEFGDSTDDLLILPKTSVVSVEGKDYVFVKTDINTIVRREIKYLSGAGNDISVLSGLEAGEVVITEGVVLLKGISFGL
ncbi:efflux RND transporter periplasmic adaptor subunit [Leptospira ilyithenensis]|uniref:HlyD family efflux transporter periplasmic adaptor subunit n=1 Tax=Leptospira ilyithenensis TaxID=2484901 RepID=A0A4R9LTL4_9LEPT|nr:efflux RND transporter periplasmic adaptor subunit [Leptospira ilyithenensis]TGN10503.1 HlyD family efflux transporter periplasmic adaptor subunit [Leptospira ilyithenensis]